jgi:hypothetical protein
LEHFVSFVPKPGDSEAFGPDLGFVSIPSPSSFLRSLLAKKSFFDLTRPELANRTVIMTRTSPMASCGLVAEKTVIAEANTVLNQYIFLWTEPQPFERDGYDYVDLCSRRSLQPETPKSFGGVTGSGLWRFSLAKSSESEIKPLDFQFAGVAFYQLPDTDDGIATVRFHGPRSVYERLLPQVRGWLG